MNVSNVFFILDKHRLVFKSLDIFRRNVKPSLDSRAHVTPLIRHVRNQKCVHFRFVELVAMFQSLITGRKQQSCYLNQPRSTKKLRSGQPKKTGEMNPILSNSDQGAPSTLKLDSWGFRNSEVVMAPSPSPQGPSYFQNYL